MERSMTCSFSYDGNNLITGHDDFVGNEYTIGYEGSSPFKVTSWTDPATNQTTFAYTSASSPYDKKTTVTDAEDIDIEYYFGASSGQVEKIQQSNGTDTLKIEMVYDGTTGFQTSSKDSYGNTTTISYDSVGHIDQITLPPSQQGQPSYVKTFTYSTPVSIDSVLEETEETVTDQVDATTSFLYTDNNNPCLPTSITNPLGQTSTLQYNSHGQITSLTQPTTGGTKTTTFGYHPTTADLNKMTDSLSNDTVLVRDLNGNIITAKRYEGDVDTGTLKEEIDITVDQNGIPIGQSSDVTGLSSSLTIDANAAVDSQTSELGCVSSFDYEDATSAVMPVKFSLIDPSVVDGSIFLPVIPAPTFPIMPYDPLPATSTNAKNQTTTYEYLDNGAPYTVTNYLNQTVSTVAYDDFGRTSTVTSAYGRTVTYQYDLNSRVTSIAREGQGTISFAFDNMGNTTAITDPVKGSLSFSYNLRGDLLTNVDGSYTRDLLGRATAFSYTAGGSDTATYTPEGYVSSFNNLSYTRNGIGQLTSWTNSMNSNGSATFSYTGTGSTALGMVGSMSGTGHVGSQSYQYDSKHWLSSFSDTSKTPSPSFGYTYSSAKELTYLDYPGNLQMQQTWTSKNITSQVYQNTLTQTTYASISQSYTSDKLTGYTYNIKAGMTNFSDTVSPSYVSSGTMKEKLDTLTYSGSGRVITYGYDANHGRLNSLKYSDINPNTPFSLNYDSAGRLTSIVDPNSQTISSYSYNANNQGLLSSIAYTGNKSASFTWNAKKQITNYVYTDNSTQPATTKAWEMTYYDDGRVATHTYSLNDTYQYDWKYYYSPYGIEKAQKYNSGQLLITIDATTAPNGRMVSLYYQDHTCQFNCFTGEASAIYDPCGNLISLVAQSTGAEVWARAVDKNSTQVIGSYNPYAIEMPYIGDGTVLPPYEEPIVSPIAFTIGKGGFNVKDYIASNTDLTIAIGQNGANVSIYGDDDCEDSICGEEREPKICDDETRFPDKCECLRKYFDFHCSVYKHWCEQRYLIEVEGSSVWYSPVIFMDRTNGMCWVLAKPFSEFTEEEKDRNRKDRFYYNKVPNDPTVVVQPQQQDALETIIKPNIVISKQAMRKFKEAYENNNCEASDELLSATCSGKGNRDNGLVF